MKLIMKKGVSQVDWIVSLALFLLYITWFFVFVSPQITYNSNQDSSITFLKNDFYDEFKWSLTKTPVFLSSNYSGLLPVIMQNTLDSDDLKFSDNTPYIVWKDYLMFLSNISSGKKTYWVLNGYPYTQDYSYQGIDAKQNRLSVENMSINFNDYLVRKVKYKNNNRIKDIDFWINNDVVNVVNESLQDYGFAAFYNADLGNINHTTYVFSDNTEIYQKITTNSNNVYRLKIELDLDDYDSYYSDNLNYGSLSYSNSYNSISYNHTRITLYGSDSLTMFFDTDVSFNLTYFNTSLTAVIEFDVGDDYDYKFVFHDEGNDMQKQKVSSVFGVSKQIEGLYLNNITTNYTYLKNKWGFDNFYILVYENSSENINTASYEIGIFNPEKRNVYAETENLESLNQDGTYTPISVNYRIW